MPYAEMKEALKTYTGTVIATLGATNYTFPASDLQTGLGIPVPPVEGDYGEYKVSDRVSGWLNVRASASLSGFVVSKLYPGTLMTLILPNLVNADGYQWGKIRAGTVVGYVAMSLVDSTVVVPPPASTNKIGFHFMGTLSGSDIQKAIAARATVYKTVDNIGALQMVIDAGVQATYIFRKYDSSYADSDKWINDHGGIDGAVSSWISLMSPIFNALPKSVYYESFNEVGASDLYLAFETERVKRMAALGRRCCVLNIATGNTEFPMWDRAAPLVRACISAGALVGTHNYAQTVISSGYGTSGWVNGQWQGSLFPVPNKTDGATPPNAWHACRYERDLWYLRKIGLGGVKMVSTEGFLDDMIDPNGYPAEGKTRGWNDGKCEVVWRNRSWVNAQTTKEQFVRKQFVWWNDIMNREPNLAGATLFTFGESADLAWVPFDTRPAY